MSNKFLGPTKGNSDLEPCLDIGEIGGSGEAHAPGPSGKFLGATKGNRDLDPNVSDQKDGGSGESHSGGPAAGKFLGPTKGNTDLPIDRTAGVKSGPRHVAGGSNAGKPGY